MTGKLTEAERSRIRTLYLEGMTVTNLHRMYPQVSNEKIRRAARKVTHEGPSRVKRMKDPKKPSKADRKRAAILEYVRQHPRCRQRAICLTLNLTPSNVHLHIKALRHEGAVRYADGRKDLLATDIKASVKTPSGPGPAEG